MDRLDQGAFGFGAGGSQLTYQGLYGMVAKALYRTHVEGKLKEEILKVSLERGGEPVGGGVLQERRGSCKNGHFWTPVHLTPCKMPGLKPPLAAPGHPAGPLPMPLPQDPARFVELDPDLPRTLLDQRDSGKVLCLITNSDFT